MDPVRWGILSTARINRAVIPGLQESEASELVAVASRDLGRAEAYAREWGIPRAFGSYDELLADAEVEAVYVSLPNDGHVPWSIRALESGKHVLCEKPLTRRPADAERAFDTADRAGRHLVEAFMYRHHPQTRRVEELLRAGAVGEVRHVHASFGFLLGDATDVRLRPELDGGALMDLGCYCVSGARLAAGAEPVEASARQVVGPTGVDLRLAGTLVFPDGVLAQLDCGFDLAYRLGLEVTGTEGILRVAHPWTCETVGIELRRGGGTELVEVEAADRYRLQGDNVSRAIRGLEAPLLGREEALGQARTIAALYASAEQGGAPVPVV
ncbi:MAG TPA: Gfo/Idh/MocA family oxidoreductase [Gaiellaceae bacterium]|nr:Gfo/Idh/MocA family oxidoreductase [Gaiellaceae bacterium]